ncbi:MAG: GspH/FimT family pseudopilin [Sulfuricaulis sp.]
MSATRIQRGFTLIEVAVVMLIIVIILGIAGVNLEPNPEIAVRDEANRMALLLQDAQQESILQGKILAVAFEPGVYHFLMLDDHGEFQPLSDDDILHSRPLLQGVTVSSVDIDGVKDSEAPRLLLLPSGELPAFTITLARGDQRWQVQGTLTGEITAQAAPVPAPGTS